MPLSSIGFGHNPFGQHQFGFGDWAEEMLWKNIPDVYRDLDSTGPDGSAVETPLRKFQNALKASYQEIRIKWHQFPSLWDAIRVPLDQLPQLAYNVGVTVDPTKSEGLQRSSVLNAAQLWVNKGTDKGYELTAAFEGLLVTIVPLWAKTCGPASLTIGTIGDSPVSFDLSSGLLVPRPFPPGTLHLEVTTEFGVVENITDDGGGNLEGSGNVLNGPMYRIDSTATIRLSITSIAGLFHVGDVIQQGGPGISGIVKAWNGNTINLLVTAGVFGAGVIDNVTTAVPSIATVVSTDSDALSRGEIVVGLTSNTRATIRDFTAGFILIDRVTTLAGFTPGETIKGLSSESYIVVGTTAELLGGPLQARLELSSLVGTFSNGDEIAGGTSGATGVVRYTPSSTEIYVGTITQPGFSVGEIISAGGNSAQIDLIDFGTIDYIAGLMAGRTRALLPGSSINSVVDLITTGPTEFLPNYDEVSADLVIMDDVQSSRYDKWPLTYTPVSTVGGILTKGYCRSHSLRLYFYTPDNTEIENFDDVASRIHLALESFRPLHVEFDKVSFDGARASSQIWRTGPIVADAAAASLWTITVTGSKLASSQIWHASSITATVES